VALKFAEITWV